MCKIKQIFGAIKDILEDFWVSFVIILNNPLFWLQILVIWFTILMMLQLKITHDLNELQFDLIKMQNSFRLDKP